MTLATKLILIATLVLSIILPFGYYLIGEKNKKRYKRAIGTNAFFYFGAFLVASIMMFGGNVQAAEAATSASIATGLDISLPLLLPVYHVSVVVSPLPVLLVLLLEQSVKILAYLVNH